MRKTVETKINGKDQSKGGHGQGREAYSYTPDIPRQGVNLFH